MARESYTTDKKLYASMADMPDSRFVIYVKGIVTQTDHDGYCSDPGKETKEDTPFDGYLTYPDGLDYKRDLDMFTKPNGVVNPDDYCDYGLTDDKLQLKRLKQNSRNDHHCRGTGAGTSVSFSEIKIMKKNDDKIF